MITKFKLFEQWNTNWDNARELVDQLDNDFINTYFRDNYNIGDENLAYYVNIWDFVDDDRFVKDYIEDGVQGATIDDFCKSDYADYIKKNLLDDDIVIKILKQKAKKLKLDNFEDIVDYELKEKELIKIIKDDDKVEEFIRDYYEESYSKDDAETILSGIYGRDDLFENGMKYVANYIDEDEVIESFYKNSDSDFKLNFLGDELLRDKNLQKKLLKMDSENAILLFDVMEEDDSIGDTFKYQDTYLKEYMTEDYNEFTIAEKLKELNDKFGLNPDIEKKYNEYMFLITSQNYNL